MRYVIDNNGKPLSTQIFLIIKMSVFMSAAYIQVHFRLDLIIEASALNPDQTTPLAAV